MFQDDVPFKVKRSLTVKVEVIEWFFGGFTKKCLHSPSYQESTVISRRLPDFLLLISQSIGNDLLFRRPRAAAMTSRP